MFSFLLVYALICVRLIVVHKLNLFRGEMKMSSDRIMVLVAVVAAVLAVFVSAFAYWALVLLALGLVYGFMHTETDLVRASAYTIAAIGLPIVANQLDVIPVVGGYLNSIIDMFAIAIAGNVIANWIMDMKNRIIPASDGGSSM